MKLITRPWVNRRLTLRTRLTLWYGGAVAILGAVIVAVVTSAATSAAVGSSASFDVPDLVVISDPSDTLSPYSDSVLLSTSARRAVAGDTAELERLFAEGEADLRAQIVHDTLLRSAIVLAAAVAFAGLLGWLIAARAVRPLQQVTSTIHRVAEDNLSERIALRGPADEIQELADTFDAMLERLDQSFEGQRRFVANASHELRTPLTINRTVLEVALADPEASDDLRTVGSKLLTVNSRHERLIEGLLTLAAADQRVAQPAAVDMADVVRTAVSQSRAQDHAADRLGIHTEIQAVTVAGDELLLERMVQNLVDNAFRYNTTDGFVRIRLTQPPHVPGMAVLTVENSGPPVPSQLAEGLFEPFRRLDQVGRDQDRSAGYVKGGLGLGMSIVRSVAHAHGGTARARSRKAGGLKVEVRLPAQPTAISGSGHARQ